MRNFQAAFVGIAMVFFSSTLFANQSKSAQKLFKGIGFQKSDSILVVDASGKELYNWQAEKLLVPASLTKLATAYAAIDKWGLDFRFSTDFYRVKDTLWIKGFGDPFLVSEELDLLVKALPLELTLGIKSLKIDNAYFDITTVPGRSKVSDPYNAPLSAVSANFNTANIGRINGKLQSLETQTPLTPTARKVAHTLIKKRERVNLINANNAQTNFAELLAIKLGMPDLKIHINQSLNGCFKLGYRHLNSHTLADVLRGTLEFSNNFMANQVFLMLGENTADQMSFAQSAALMKQRLSRQFNWQGHSIVEGAGLSRANRLSAHNIEQLLSVLSPHKSLLKNIKNKAGVQVYAKTGTLDGVRSYAGFIELKSQKFQGQEFRFVFNFNRKVPYKYRDQILERLLRDLNN